jgi:hypothetical protein
MTHHRGTQFIKLTNTRFDHSFKSDEGKLQRGMHLAVVLPSLSMVWGVVDEGWPRSGKMRGTKVLDELAARDGTLSISLPQ